MDLYMPEVDGLTAAQAIRQPAGRRAQVPITAVTAFDTIGLEEAAREAGCADYVRKPLDDSRPEKAAGGLIHCREWHGELEGGAAARPV
jgi:CheY-like chemotaxis protein